MATTRVTQWTRASILGGFIAAAGWIAREPLLVATGSVSQALCGAAFISHVDPGKVFEQQEVPLIGPVASVISVRVDRERHDVRASILGLYGQRAVYRGRSGCLLTHGDPVSGAADAPFAADVPNEAPLVAPADPIIARALDEAFSERDPARPRNTLAMVVMRDGQVVAERYAPGYDLNTPIWAHSITKSVTHALIGALIQQGRARLDQTVELKSAKAPAEHATLDALLRMTSGLPFDETGGVVNPMTRLFFLERDMAEFAASTAPVTHPGREWGYSNLGYLLLGRVVRDANSDPTQLSEDFIRETLFVPLHMNHSLIETDVTDTPVAASHLYTTARDLAKFGQLYLDDGVVDGRRVLPEGWVQQARTRTLNTGYGAGFWLNHRQSGTVPVWDAPWGMPTLPEDMFYARGAFGQYVIIVPSQRLVVVRLGFTPDYRTGIEEAVAKIISAFAARPKVHSDST